MNTALSFPLSSQYIDPGIRLVNNLDGAIRSTNRPDRNRHWPGHTLIGDAAASIRCFDDCIRVDDVGPEPLRVAHNRLTAGDREYTFDGDGNRRFCQAVGAPHAYLEKLPADLRNEILQYHVDQRHYIKGRLGNDNSTVISRNGRFLAFGRSDLLSLTGSEVFSVVVDAIGEPDGMLSVSGLSFAAESVAVEIVSRQVATEVRPGDVICGGLRVVHSHVGGDATLIHSFALRLVCANGLVHRECTGPRRTARTRRLPTGSKQAKDRQLEQIHRLTRQSWSHTQRLLDSVEHLHEEPVTDPRIVFERYLRSGRLFSQNLVESLLEAWAVEDSEANAYGVLNALTRVATHDSRLSARQRRALAALAGIFAQKNTHICPHCFSVISTVN